VPGKGLHYDNMIYWIFSQS